MAITHAPSLPGKVAQFLDGLGCPEEATVVAVSGGPDSVALALALRQVRPAVRLVVAHLNHGLRGAESDADEAFVRRLPDTIGAPVELRCDRHDVATQTRLEAGNLEDVARRVRYDWLARVASETGCRWVATGHVADDQAETVLHRMLRGSGLRGLRGIAPRKPLNAEVTLIRPLLRVARAEVMEYLASKGQEYRIDRSNFDLAFTRNRIRHELLPHLAETYNPEVAAVLSRLAEQADAAYRILESLARELLAAAELPRAGPLLIFEQSRLAAAPRDLIRETFRQVWDREGWPQNDMSFEAWDRLAGVVLDATGSVDLPGGIRARRRGRIVQLGSTDSSPGG